MLYNRVIREIPAHLLGILEDEYDIGMPLDNEDKAIQKAESSMGSYNRKHPRNSLEGDTPEQKYNEDSWKQDLDSSWSTHSRTKHKTVNAEQDKIKSCQLISVQS